MQQFENQQGLIFSADQLFSVECFDDVIEAYLGASADVMSKLTVLLEQDPDMPMAHCFKAYLMKLGSDPRLLGAMDDAIERLKVMRPTLNDRETRHLAALAYWSDNQSKDTIRIIEELLTLYPHDILALRINHHLHFYSGDAPRSIELCPIGSKTEGSLTTFLVCKHSVWKKVATINRLKLAAGKL